MFIVWVEAPTRRSLRVTSAVTSTPTRLDSIIPAQVPLTLWNLRPARDETHFLSPDNRSNRGKDVSLRGSAGRSQTPSHPPTPTPEQISAAASPHLREHQPFRAAPVPTRSSWSRWMQWSDSKRCQVARQGKETTRLDTTLVQLVHQIRAPDLCLSAPTHFRARVQELPCHAIRQLRESKHLYKSFPNLRRNLRNTRNTDAGLNAKDKLFPTHSFAVEGRLKQTL